jgi:hypothetical protein
LRTRGLVASDGIGPSGDGAGLTADGRALAQRAVTARRTLLDEALADADAKRDPAVEELLRRLARELTGEPPAPVGAPAVPAAAAGRG